MLHHPEGDDVFETKPGIVYDWSDSRRSFTQNGTTFVRGMLCDYHHTSYTWRLGLISHPMLEHPYFVVWDLQTGQIQDEVKIRPIAPVLLNKFDQDRVYRSWRLRCLNGQNNLYNPPGQSNPYLP